MKKILKWVGIIFLIFVVIGVLSGGSKNSTSKTSPSATVVPQKAKGVTMEQFTTIKEGMTYEEVVAVLGSEGEVLSSNEVGGYKTVMYKWDGAAVMSNMNATFQNGKMMSKAQFGLK